MTDITKYRNVSLTHETYKTLISLSKVLLPDAQLSISKTIESIANEKAKKLNGKLIKCIEPSPSNSPAIYALSVSGIPESLII